MQTKWDAPFNLFGWSLGIFLLFAMIQVAIVTTVTMLGYSPSVFLTLFSWGAVMGAIAFTLVTRYQAELRHLLLVQGFALFYLFAIAYALQFKSSGSVLLSGQVLSAIVALFASGTIGVVVARMARERMSR